MWFDSEQPSNRILVIDDNLDIHQDFKVILDPDASVDTPLDDLESDLFGPAVKDTPQPGSRWTNYDLAFASQGKEGLALVQEGVQQDRPFALAFVDMRMPPGWNGLETIERLWEVDRDLQVVICTAYSDFSQLEIMKRLGRSDNLLILKKPFDPEEIAQITVTMLQKREMTRRAALNLEQMERLVAERTEAMARSQFHEGRTRQAMDNLLHNLDGQENRFVKTEKLATLGQMMAAYAGKERSPVHQFRGEIHLLEGFLRTLERNIAAFHRLADDLHAGRPVAAALAEAETVTHRADLAATLQDTGDALLRLTAQADAMDRDLASVRDFAAQENGLAEFTDLNQAVGTVLDLARSFLGTDVTLETRLEQLPPLGCVPGQILQVISALVMNAIEATSGQERRVTIHTWAENETAFLSVQDNGCGISEDNLPRVFDPYFTTKGRHWGTGLGLGVARDIVQQHSGNLTVESRENEGTTLTLAIPLEANQPGTRPGDHQVERLLTRVPVGQ